MLDQTFSLTDLPRLFTLIFLEGVLSLDNALAIALIIRALPLYLRAKALFIGLISAVVLRAIGVFCAAYLIQLSWIRWAGGGYLIYLSLSHLLSKKRADGAPSKVRSFWMVVAMVELTDFLFALDSILAGVALIGVKVTPHNLPSKLWIVYVGGVAGLVLMRFAAKLLTHLVDTFPRLEQGAHLIVGWIGIKLILEGTWAGLPSWSEPLFWCGIALFFSFGFLKNRPQS